MESKSGYNYSHNSSRGFWCFMILEELFSIISRSPQKSWNFWILSQCQAELQITQNIQVQHLHHISRTYQQLCTTGRTLKPLKEHQTYFQGTGKDKFSWESGESPDESSTQMSVHHLPQHQALGSLIPKTSCTKREELTKENITKIAPKMSLVSFLWFRTRLPSRLRNKS